MSEDGTVGWCVVPDLLYNVQTMLLDEMVQFGCGGLILRMEFVCVLVQVMIFPPNRLREM